MTRRQGLTLVEFIVACAIIFVLIGVGSLYFQNALRAFREVTLKNQLADARLSLKLYQVLHNRYPKDIKQLLTEEVNFIPYSVEVIKKRYLESVRSDKRGFPLDPFGNRFIYRADIGEVRSGTKGYEEW